MWMWWSSRSVKKNSQIGNDHFITSSFHPLAFLKVCSSTPKYWFLFLFILNLLTSTSWILIWRNHCLLARSCFSKEINCDSAATWLLFNQSELVWGNLLENPPKCSKFNYIGFDWICCTVDHIGFNKIFLKVNCMVLDFWLFSSPYFFRFSSKNSQNKIKFHNLIKVVSKCQNKSSIVFKTSRSLPSKYSTNLEGTSSMFFAVIWTLSSWK